MGLLPVELDNLYDGALLHDVGKVGVPAALIDKTERPTEEEWARIRAHTYTGAERCAASSPKRSAASSPSTTSVSTARATPTARPGRTSPSRRASVAVADAFDSITHPRACALRGRLASVPYAEAAQEIDEWSGRQFDPRVVKAVLSVPESEWLRLTSGLREPDA